MELAVLLRELLLCSFPNGEKFNYQLICCVVSGDMKFPIVSTSIKRSASTQLFRQLNAKIAGGHNDALIRFVLQTWHHMCQQINILILHSETFQILNTPGSVLVYISVRFVWNGQTNNRDRPVHHSPRRACWCYPLGPLKQYVMIGCLKV